MLVNTLCCPPTASGFMLGPCFDEVKKMARNSENFQTSTKGAKHGDTCFKT